MTLWNVQVSHKDMSEELSPLEEHTHSPIMPRDSMYDSESGQASVYLYKRDKESAAEILQPLISQDPRHFRSALPLDESLSFQIAFLIPHF